MVEPREDHKEENNIYDSHQRIVKPILTSYFASRNCDKNVTVRKVSAKYISITHRTIVFYSQCTQVNEHTYMIHVHVRSLGPLRFHKT